MPTLPAALAMDRTYQALASSVVAVTTASRGAVPAADRTAARSATSARIAPASSFPDRDIVPRAF